MVEFTNPKINNRGMDIEKDWSIWYRAKHPVTGQWKLFVLKKGINRFKTKRERMKEAIALRDSITFMLKRNNYNPFKGVRQDNFDTLIDALNSVLELKRATIRKRSITHYNDTLTLFKNWLTSKGWSKIAPGKFTHKDAIAYSDYLLTERGHSGKTRNIHISSLRTFFYVLIKREFITDNPFVNMERIHESDGSNVPYTEEEKTKLLPYMKEHNPRLYYAACFVFFCFIRRTELIHLKVGNVKPGVIIIPAASSKTDRTRSVTIPTAFEPILAEMQLEKYSPDDYVFGHRFKTCSRRIIKPESLTYAMTRINKKFGIENKSFYAWKHSGMVALYNATHDPYTCMAQAGHSELKMTQRYLRSLGLIVDQQVRRADFHL